MTRALDNRLAKLEAKRRMHDDDLTRLSDEELNARIERLTLQIVAEYGGIESADRSHAAGPALIERLLDQNSP